jgi:hypothetical protein
MSAYLSKADICQHNEQDCRAMSGFPVSTEKEIDEITSRCVMDKSLAWAF